MFLSFSQCEALSCKAEFIQKMEYISILKQEFLFQDLLVLYIYDITNVHIIRLHIYTRYTHVFVLFYERSFKCFVEKKVKVFKT